VVNSLQPHALLILRAIALAERAPLGETEPVTAGRAGEGASGRAGEGASGRAGEGASGRAGEGAHGRAGARARARAGARARGRRGYVVGRGVLSFGRMNATGTAELTQALARRASALAHEQLPDDVVEIAQQALLDWFAVTLGGSAEDAPRTLLEVLSTGGTQRGSGTASVVGHRVRVHTRDAAFVNGVSSHVLDFDDVNIKLISHVTVAILAAALALAEDLDASARELLTAYVAGYETASRVAVAVGNEHYFSGFHSTGTIGTFGAAAACARLLGLDGQRTAVALGIAASEAAGVKANIGTMTKSFHAGKACENGLLAAMLAGRGFTANASAIEASQGFAAISGGTFDPDAALAEPPSGWHLRDNLFKQHASCYFTHSTIEGLRELAPEPADVERVTVHVSDSELGTCVIGEPQTGLEVKFSIAHLAAMTLLGHSTSVIADEIAFDEDVIAARSRIALVPDGTPGEPTRVEVALRDGTVLEAARDVNTPERDLAAQRERLSAKFNALAEPVLGEAGASDLLAALSALDGDDGVRALMTLARR
jgi:2-methylcitrate dehydratase PrpD